MGFCGYRYRFGLYAAHSNITNSEEDVHFHNFTITLYINAAGRKNDDNFNVERAVKEWLVPYQGQSLAKMELFTGKETTVEGMGNTFFDPLYDLVEAQGYELVKLQIYENPIRVFVVSGKRLDHTVNEIGSIPLECLPIIQIDDEQKLSSEDREETAENRTMETNDLSESTEEINNLQVMDSNEVKSFEAEETIPDEYLNQLDTEKETFLEEAALTIEQGMDAAILQNQPASVQETFTLHKSNTAMLLLKAIIGLACFCALAVVTMYIVKTSGRYPQGTDTLCHLYRADLILKNIKQGNWYPLYDPTWYNGVEVMRYWGPLPLYLIAGLEYILKSSVLNAYVLFLGVLILLGGCGWLLWGITYRRVELSIFIGLLWFFMPENMRVVIVDGNLPRGVINALLPFYFYFLWNVISEKKKNAIAPLVFVTALITLCHLGITIMLIATSAIFIFLYSKMNHSPRSALCALGASISGVLAAGIWVVPALIGGAANGSSTNQVMKIFFESAAVSLNPFTRINGDTLSFYFGLSIFLICLFGMLFGSKKVIPGFVTVIVLFLCTTKSTYMLFSKLPFSQYLWMVRFIPIGLAIAMVSFFLWKQLRKWAVVLFCILLAADCFTSYQYIYFPEKEWSKSAEADLDTRAESLLITKAKKITSQRLAVLDLSKYGSFAPYYITGVGKSVNYTFGAGWEGASTASNIVNLNSAVEDGWYVYLFDRSLELGNDTVLIPIQNLKEKNKDVDNVTKAAKVSGFHLVDNNGESLLYHKDTTDQFGIVTKYDNIAIGASASLIAMIFPDFKEATKNNINDYTFEELSKYQVIYLSGFTCDDKVKAEELLLKLAKHGVQVYIDMNNAPVDKATRRIKMFGVNAQSITFTEAYPELFYQEGSYTSLDFSSDISQWNTCYLDGLEQEDGYYSLSGDSFPYIGTSKNKNLHFIGLNLIYYLQTTRDFEIKRLMEAVFGMNADTVPDRKVVPISIKTSSHKIEINSDYDNVNTTLSDLDIFSSKNSYKTYNNLIMVNSGETILHIRYPHLKKGIPVTMIGIGLAVFIYTVMQKIRRQVGYDEIKESKESKDR